MHNQAQEQTIGIRMFLVRDYLFTTRERLLNSRCKEQESFFDDSRTKNFKLTIQGPSSIFELTSQGPRISFKLTIQEARIIFELTSFKDQE